MKGFENTFNKHKFGTIDESTMRSLSHFHLAMKTQLDAVCAVTETAGEIY